MTIDSFVKSKNTIPEFNIREIVEARDKLWLIDNILLFIKFLQYIVPVSQIENNQNVLL